MGIRYLATVAFAVQFAAIRNHDKGPRVHRGEHLGLELRISLQVCPCREAPAGWYGNFAGFQFEVHEVLEFGGGSH